MRNDILDEGIKYTGSRTCPECGHQFPLEKFVKRYIMAYGLSKWSCQGCGELIKCNFITVQITSLAGLVVSGVLFAVMTAYVDLGFFNFIFLLPGCALFLLAFYYVKFEKYE
ncbi:MAG: hypothetical protein NXI23_14650 [Bacteroidetes bacterium]|nr:hypothetical protein [Bacteroidota bacterium]